MTQRPSKERIEGIRNFVEGSMSPPYGAYELLAEIDALEAENKRLLEWGIHEGNRVSNLAADRHTELVLERDRLNERVAVLETENSTLRQLAEMSIDDRILQLAQGIDQLKRERDAALRALRGEVGAPDDPGELGVFPLSYIEERDRLKELVAKLREKLYRVTGPEFLVEDNELERE